MSASASIEARASWCASLLLLLLSAAASAQETGPQLTDLHADEVRAAEQQLYGPLGERNIVSSVRRLQSLAVGGGGAQARAQFVLGALEFTGTLPQAVLAWNRSRAFVALRHAAQVLPAAKLHVSDHFVWRSAQLCSYGVRHLKGVAEELMRVAEQELHHPDVPTAPLRLRDRLRDGTWRSIAEDDEVGARDKSAEGIDAGFRHLQLGDNAAAAQAFEAAAASGDAYAQFNLGYMHMKGLVPSVMPSHANFSEAERLLRMAAAKGVGAALNSLGVMAFNGMGVARNISRARELFDEAAALDEPDLDALYNLGLLHADGAAMDAAADALQAASDAGHWKAPHTLALMHLDGTHPMGPSCARAAQLLYTWVEERLGWAAAVDEAVAALDGGDVQGALVQLSLLAAQGCDAAGANIAYMLMQRHGALTPWFDWDEARDRALAMLNDSARRGSADALVDLGIVSLASGDWQSAMQHFQAADNTEGLVSLALMHLRGRDHSSTVNSTHARLLLVKAYGLAPYDEDLAPVAVLLTAVRVLAVMETVLRRRDVYAVLVLAFLAKCWAWRHQRRQHAGVTDAVQRTH